MSPRSQDALQARRFLKDQAYDQIKQDILSGRLTSDAFLSERTLAERLQLGKAPVRDAINRLRQENYLTVVPQQGILVKPRTAKEIGDTFEARLMIEPQVASRLAGKLSPSDQRSLEANLKHQQECVTRGDGIEFVKWDVEFHMGLVRALGNEDLVSMMDRICERTFAAITQAFHGSASRVANAHKAHKSIFAAIVSGDSDSAMKRMNSHIAETWKGEIPTR